MSDGLLQKLKTYRISTQEYDLICSLLGREPEGAEWAVFSALWSEHCSYKSSKVHLRKFSYRNDKVVGAAGENAGIVDLGEGEKIAFKMESHNHPSFIEPYQGAATGVGGILRDIFTMGARPIALANYLCFGDELSPRMKEIIRQVVKGISGYGNCVGVPMLTGATHFDHSYQGNVLVNAMAVGLILDGDPIVFSGAKGIGNSVVYVGAKTGKDGVHGASMASESFADDSESKKPNIQIGDPFLEKLLIESCLEILKLNLVVAMQDMGAAGLTSSSFEMAAKGEVGMKLNLDAVPLRDSSMLPEEILLSESQERMLLICEPKNADRVKEVFAKWGLDACVIGEITKGPEVELYWQGKILNKINPKMIVDQAPVYERPFETQKNVRLMPLIQDDLRWTLPELSSRLQKYFLSLKGHDKSWIYGQYDQKVGGKTARSCESSISALRLPKSHRSLLMALGCRPDLMALDPRMGSLDAVFYPALQMASKGGKVVAYTDCLNFGNPEKIAVMSDFVAAVEAIAQASRLLDAPVISGNVSFYNETMGNNILPTPAIGSIGLAPGVENLPEDNFSAPDLQLYVFELAWTRVQGGKFQSILPNQSMIEFIEMIRNAVLDFKPNLCRVVGDAGLAATLVKMSGDGISFKVADENAENFILKKPICYYQVVMSLTSAQAQKVNAPGRLPDLVQFIHLGSTVKSEWFLKDNFVKHQDIQKLSRQVWPELGVSYAGL